MGKERKKLRDTKVGVWLREKAPEVLDVVGDLLPEKGALGVIKNLLDKPGVDPAVRQEYERMWLEFHTELEQGVTRRWEADMGSDSWLSKNVRPLALASVLLVFFILIFLDSMAIEFDVTESYQTAYKEMTVLIISAYFGARTLDKMGVKIGR